MSEYLASRNVALIAAQWHSDLVSIAVDSCEQQLAVLGFDIEAKVSRFVVPGSLELPLLAKKLLASDNFDAAIVFGWIVDGGIYRHEFVSQAVLDGIMAVGLETLKPVFSVALTPKSFNEASEKDREFFANHLVGKGREAAGAAAHMLKTLDEVSN